MNRRAFVALAGSVTLAGCSGTSSSTPTERSSTTEATTRQTSPETERTTTETESTTTETTTSAPSPTIESADLLTHWNEFGDVEKNAVNAVGLGSTAVIGWHYSLPIHDGKSEETVQVTIYDEEGPSVTSRQKSDTHITNQTGSDEWERWFGFETADWEKGEYFAEILVRDDVSGKNSGVTEVNFTVNEPLGKGEASIESTQYPDSVTVGEEVTFELTFANTSNRDGSIVSSLSARYNDGSWQSVSDSKFELNVGANSTRTWNGNAVSFDSAGTYTYRLDDVEETWSIEVTE